MATLADDLCAEVRRQCEQAEHFKSLWMQANDELEMARGTERLWEQTMMGAIGEDGVGSVAKAIEALKNQNAYFRVVLEKLATYPISRSDEMSAKVMRDVARSALSKEQAA